MHVARVVKDHSYVDALAGNTCARAARQNRSAGCAAGCESRFHIACVTGKNNADGKLAIVGAIGGVKGARAKIEADLSAQRLLQQRFQLAVCGEPLMVERSRIRKDGKRKCTHAEMVRQNQSLCVLLRFFVRRHGSRNSRKSVIADRYPEPRRQTSRNRAKVQS